MIRVLNAPSYRLGCSTIVASSAMSEGERFVLAPARPLAEPMRRGLSYNQKLPFPLISSIHLKETSCATHSHI